MYSHIVAGHALTLSAVRLHRLIVLQLHADLGCVCKNPYVSTFYVHIYVHTGIHAGIYVYLVHVCVCVFDSSFPSSCKPISTVCVRMCACLRVRACVCGFVCARVHV